MNWEYGPPTIEPRDGELVGMDIEMFQQSKPLHLPTGHFACLTVSFRDRAWLIDNIPDVRETFRRTRKGLWAFHNANYDLIHLRRYVDIPKRPIWDTMLIERHLFGGHYTTTFGLGDLARRWLSHFMSKDTRSDFITKDYMTEEMKRYAAWDALETWRIAEAQREYIETRKVNMKSYNLVNGPAIWSFLDMQPMRFDKDLWIKTSRELELLGIRIEDEIGINVYSPPQVKAFVKDHLDLDREPSNTAADTLRKWAKDEWVDNDGGDPVVKDILRARSYRKMGSHYGEKFISTLDEDGYLLPGWILDGAVTGRGACRDPNLQQVPVRQFPEFRDAILPSPGNVFLGTDASSQEPRIGAQLTQDPDLLELFRSGENIYVGVAKELFGEEIKKGTPRYDQMKAVTLGTFYRLTASGLAKREGIPRKAASEIQDAFLHRFSKVPVWLHRQTQQALSHYYIETPLLRRIGINVHDGQWINQVANYPIQSGAGEQTKLAMNYLHEQCEAEGLPYRVILQVHDEIDSDVPPKLADKYLEMTRDAWHEAARVVIPDVPMEVDHAIGDSWGVMK